MRLNGCQVCRRRKESPFWPIARRLARRIGRIKEYARGTRAAIYIYSATVYTTLSIRARPTRPTRSEGTPHRSTQASPGQAVCTVKGRNGWASCGDNIQQLVRRWKGDLAVHASVYDKVQAGPTPTSHSQERGRRRRKRSLFSCPSWAIPEVRNGKKGRR
jgi:hypothetical protein